MNESKPVLSLPPLRALLTRRTTWLVAAGTVGAAVVVLLGLAAFRSGDPMRHFTAKVMQGEIRDVVDATGTVSAVITVQVGSQVSGTIAELRVDFNSRVKKGDVIAVIAPQLFQGALLQTTADLANARANVLVSEANLQKARATLAQTKAEFDRVMQLAEQKIESQQAVDLAKANFDTARASVEGAVANIAQAAAQVRQKEAAESVARTNLDYTVIRSPIDGTVVARNVDVGQTVAASLQAPTVFTIAQDLKKMQVYTKVDESDVGRIKLAQEVAFKVDAFPKERFKGSVTQVRMNPTRIQNVVTYDTIIDFDNPDLKLFPGMTAYVTIPVASVGNVVKLPNAAIRYKPPFSLEKVKELYAKAGIDEGSSSVEKRADAEQVKDGTSRPGRADGAVVWKLAAGQSLQPVKVALGITDHTFTEVTKVVVGSLAPGDEVVTSSMQSKSAPPGGQTPGGRR
jgi:HlyD family secretion protein